MNSSRESNASRRLLLQFVAASPLLAVSRSICAADAGAPSPPSDPMVWAPLGSNGIIKRPEDAIDVFDFELAAHERVPPAHFGYMASGADDESTLRANRADFQKFALRPRRLRNVSRVDSSIDLLGARWDSPIFICPAGSNRAFHPDGELAVSRAAAAAKQLQMYSAFSSYSIEEAIKARGEPIWFQLYATADIGVAKELITRAERAGCPGLAITVDSVAARKNETMLRMARLDTRNCETCHETAGGGRRSLSQFSNFSGFESKRLEKVPLLSTNMDWDFVRRLRDSTKMKVILKGIIDPQDAAQCAKHGFDGVLISNHGGREEGGGASTIGVLPEIVAAVNGKIPILIDSGFRRGMDVVKALAMGATAVGIGRPYLWGLGAFGQEGVTRVLEILRAEVLAAMAEAGAPTVKDLVPSIIHKS